MALKFATYRENITRYLKNTPSDGKSGLKKLFIEELEKIYWAEKKLKKGLNIIKKACFNSTLATLAENHLQITDKQILRIEKIFYLMNERIKTMSCDIAVTLIKEAKNIIKKFKTSACRDAALIFVAQKIEHYEIAIYGTLEQFASNLGREDIADILHETLVEEKESDKNFTQLALSYINANANSEIGYLDNL